MTDFGTRDGGSAGSETLRHTYDWKTTRPSAAVVELVAIAADREPFGLRPLFETVDPDALDAIIGRNGGRTAEDTRVSLQYAGHDVTVRGDGEVVVTPMEADRAGE